MVNSATRVAAVGWPPDRLGAAIRRVPDLIWLALAAAFLLRRMTGHLTAPLRGWEAWAALAGLISLVWVTRAFLAWHSPEPYGRRALLRHAWPGIALLLVLASAPLPTAGWWRGALPYCLLLVTEVAWWGGWRRRWSWRALLRPRGVEGHHAVVDQSLPPDPVSERVGSAARETAMETAAAADEGPEVPPRASGPPAPASEGAVLHWTRHHEADGQVVTSGSWNMGLAAVGHDRRIHVPFCPPYAARPEVSIEVQGEGLSARIVQVFPQGMRIDCRYAGPPDPPPDARAEIEFYAVGAEAGRLGRSA